MEMTKVRVSEHGDWLVGMSPYNSEGKKKTWKKPQGPMEQQEPPPQKSSTSDFQKKEKAWRAGKIFEVIMAENFLNLVKILMYWLRKLCEPESK